MAKKIFITGTGTDIGKTYISGLICKKLKDANCDIAYYKAAVSGNERDEKLKENKFQKHLIAAFAGFIVCYAIGLTYKYFMLNFYIGNKTAFALVLLDCFPLDMPGDIVLSILSAICTRSLKPYYIRLVERNH